MEGLSQDERQSIATLYQTRLERGDDPVATVGWGSKESQWLRFEELFRGLDPRGKRILDVGSGLGDLIYWLEERVGSNFDYLGVDITPAFVSAARERHPGTWREFRHADILSEELHQRFDIVVMSGALNVRIDDNMSHCEAMLARMYELCDEAVSANFLSTYVDYQVEKNFHYAPETLFGVAKRLSPRVCLNHDYPLYEFTLQIKRPRKAT